VIANDSSLINRAATDKGSFCPACGSAQIESSELGGPAKCLTCTWSGPSSQLNVYRFDHGHGSKEEVLLHFARDVRALLGKEMSLELGKLLLKWGFVSLPGNDKDEQKLFSRTVARYIGGAAQAIAKSVVETRAAIEKEEHDARST
jgi:hypothetical protein